MRNISGFITGTRTRILSHDVQRLSPGQEARLSEEDFAFFERQTACKHSGPYFIFEMGAILQKIPFVL